MAKVVDRYDGWAKEIRAFAEENADASIHYMWGRFDFGWKKNDTDNCRLHVNLHDGAYEITWSSAARDLEGARACISTYTEVLLFATALQSLIATLPPLPPED